MHRITLILILFLLLPDMYIYLVYIVKKTRNIIWRSAYWLPTAILVAIYIYYIYLTGDNALSHHPQSIGRLAVAVMLFAVPKTVFMLCSLLGILMRGISRLLSFIISIRHSGTPAILRCPPASLYASRHNIRCNHFYQYPLWSNGGYYTF